MTITSVLNSSQKIDDVKIAFATRIRNYVVKVNKNKKMGKIQLFSLCVFFQSESRAIEQLSYILRKQWGTF